MSSGALGTLEPTVRLREPSKIAPFVLDGNAQLFESSHGPRNAFGLSEFAKLASPERAAVKSASSAM